MYQINNVIFLLKPNKQIAMIQEGLDKNKNQTQKQLENQFDQLSEVALNSESAINFQPNQPKITTQITLDHTIPKITPYSDKFSYYQKLRLQNKQMSLKLKQFDSKLNQQIKQIYEKNQKINSQLKYKLRTKRSASIQIKYRELDQYKNLLDEKLRQRGLLEGLRNRVDGLRSRYKQKYTELQMKQRNLAKLKSLLQKNQQQQSRLNSNSPRVFQDIYKAQIKQLKQKLKQKTTKIYEQKQKFIDKAKDRLKKQNNSVVQLGKVELQDQETPQLQELRAKYEAIGFRIQLLKMQKKVLVQSKGGLDDLNKKLLRLKSKLAQLMKL